MRRGNLMFTVGIVPERSGRRVWETRPTFVITLLFFVVRAFRPANCRERFETVPYMTKNVNYSAQLKLRTTKEKIFHLTGLNGLSPKGTFSQPFQVEHPYSLIENNDFLAKL